MSNYILNNTLTLIPALSLIIFVSAYLSKAWNVTTLPIVVSRILSFLFIKKINAKEVLNNIATRDDWEIWSYIYMPSWLSALLNCPICQTPYLTGVVTIAVAIATEKFGLSNMTWFGVWAFCLFPVMRLSYHTPATTELSNKSSNFKDADVKKNSISDKIKIDNEPIATFETETTNASAVVENVNTITGEQFKQQENEYNLWASEMGLKIKKGEQGEQIVESFDPVMLQTLKFFETAEPCYFKGCEELRAEYANELEAKGTDCPACAKSALKRKYMILIKNKLSE